MPVVRGSIGSILIAEDTISQGSMKASSRRLDDPINCIKITCKIPELVRYNIGSMDVFDYS